MSNYSSSKGPYVGHSILIMDDKHRISMNNKLADKIKQRSHNNVLFLYACHREDHPGLRLLKLYDEEFYQNNSEEIHPGGLEETKLQTNDRLQIPLPLYHFLGFNSEHRFVLIIADRTGHYYHLYNLAAVAKDLPEQDEFGDFLPSFIEMAASCDARLKKYLTLLSTTHTGVFREGYEWLAEKLMQSQEDNMYLPSFNGNKSSPRSKTKKKKKENTSSPFPPLYEDKRESNRFG